MKDDISNKIIDLLKNDFRRDFTIPEIMNALEIKNREKIATAIARLEGENVVELSREKGRTRYYRIKEKL